MHVSLHLKTISADCTDKYTINQKLGIIISLNKNLKTIGHSWPVSLQPLKTVLHLHERVLKELVLFVSSEFCGMDASHVLHE